MEMNKKQVAHLNRITDQAMSLIISKYTKGVAEHKTTLSEDYDLDEVLNMAIDEAIDQVVYLLTAREMLRKADK